MSGRADDNHWARELFDKPIERVVDGFCADEAYEFDMTDLVLVGGEWYLVSTRGCSCPSYEEQATLEFGPGTLEQIREHVLAEYPQKYYTSVREDTVAAIDEELKKVS